MKKTVDRKPCDGQFENTDMTECRCFCCNVDKECVGEYLSEKRLRCGVFECDCGSSFDKINFIGHTDHRNLIVPAVITAPDFDRYIDFLSIIDSNPRSPSVRKICIPYREDGFFLSGNYSLIFPDLEDIMIRVRNDCSMLPQVPLSEAVPLVEDDETLEVIRDSNEYRESLLDPEALEEMREEGIQFAVLREQYVIKSRCAEFLYIAETEELILEDIYGISAKAITVPRRLVINGRSVPLTEINCTTPESVEIICVPHGCRIELALYPPIRSIHIYK